MSGECDEQLLSCCCVVRAVEQQVVDRLVQPCYVAGGMRAERVQCRDASSAPKAETNCGGVGSVREQAGTKREVRIGRCRPTVSGFRV